jgi:hypothetical protein
LSLCPNRFAVPIREAVRDLHRAAMAAHMLLLSETVTRGSSAVRLLIHRNVQPRFCILNPELAR